MLPSRPLLYDVFSGAGGAAKGYHEAGFEVVGVDHLPQPHYPYRFVQMDAFAFFEAVARGDFPPPAAWHASPPCQGYSIMRNLPWLREKDYPLLIEPTRQALEASGRPWVIENVMGARLAAGFLCGTMFGKRFYRHRYFLANWLWLAPPHPRHRITIKPDRRHNSNFVRPDEVMPAASSPGVIQSGRLLGHRARVPIFSCAEDARGAASWPGRRRDGASAHGLTTRQANGMSGGVRHTAGIAQARREMECGWMTGDELSQAIPPCFTRFVGAQLMIFLRG